MLGEWVLTDAGAAKLLSDIRAERRARHEDRTRWLPWVNCVATVLAIATAFVALVT